VPPGRGSEITRRGACALAAAGLVAVPEIDETMAPEALDATADWIVSRFGGSR